MSPNTLFASKRPILEKSVRPSIEIGTVAHDVPMATVETHSF